MSAIRILIADDHSILCESISRLLENEPDMEVVAVASDGQETVNQAVTHRPDVAVVDISMPHSGLDAIRTIHSKCPDTRSLALTMHDSANYRRAVLDAGGSGYLAKRAGTQELLRAIREVHAGRAYLGEVLEPAGASEPVPDIDSEVAPSQLSFREQEVLRLLALGFTNREISEKLGVAKKTVDTYRSRLHSKLQLRGRAQLVRYALRHRLLKGDVDDKT